MKFLVALLITVPLVLAIDSPKTGEEIEPLRKRDCEDGHCGHIIEPKRKRDRSDGHPGHIIEPRGFGDGDVIIEPVEKRNIFSICDNCVWQVGLVKSLIPNRGLEWAGSALGLLCFGSQDCKDKIQSLVLDLEETTADEACNFLMLCQKPELFPFYSSRFCHVCERVADKILPDFTNQTLEYLEQKLSENCEGDPKCLDVAAKVVGFIAELTPSAVCDKLHLCRTKEETILAKDRCDACNQKLEEVFSDENLAQLAASTKSLCNGIQVCESGVDKVFSMFAARRDNIVSDLCKIGQQC